MVAGVFLCGFLFLRHLFSRLGFVAIHLYANRVGHLKFFSQKKGEVIAHRFFVALRFRLISHQVMSRVDLATYSVCRGAP